MHSFRDLSIKYKLALFGVTTSVAALLLASLAIIAYEVITFKHQIVNDLTIRAQIIADNSVASLDFDDRASAEEILNALRADRSVIAAAIYQGDGKKFATYVGNDTLALNWPTPGEVVAATWEETHVSVSWARRRTQGSDRLR
jgi:uncharacterized membrane protein affecting hemolysin expression